MGHPQIAQISQRNHAWRLGVLVVILTLCLAGHGMAGWEGPSPLGGAAKVCPVLAEVSPGEIGSSANMGIYWLGAVIAILQVVAFFRPAPALHKQFADREDHEKTIDEIKDAIKSMNDKFEHWNTSQYDARRRMHRKINHMTSALAYFAGSIEKTEPATAKRMREIISKVDDEGDEE